MILLICNIIFSIFENFSCKFNFDIYKIYENNRFDPLLMLNRNNGIIQIKEEYGQLKKDIEQFLQYKDSL